MLAAARKLCRQLALMPWLIAPAVQADPGYYLITPYAEPGRSTLELRYWSVDTARRPRVHWPELAIRHGLGPRWSMGLLASWISSRSIHTRVDSWNWINDWLLLDGVGEQELGLALHSQLIRSKGGEHVLELGPALQAGFGPWRANLNLFVERPLDGEVRSTELKLQWQFSRRLQPGWRLGLQGFGELGPWDQVFSASGSHRAGPMLSYSHDLGHAESLQLQGAWLFGKVFGRSGRMLSLRLSYGFQ